MVFVYDYHQFDGIFVLYGVNLFLCIAYVTPITFCVYDLFITFIEKVSHVNMKNVLILYNNVLNLVVIHLINAYFTTDVSLNVT